MGTDRSRLNGARQRRWVKPVLLLGAAAILMAGVWLAVRSGEEPQPEPRAFPVSIVDDIGVTTTLAAPPQRVVSLAPQFTETIFGVDAGELIAGVSDGETYPPQALALPSVMAADGITPDPIRIGELGADLVFSAAQPGPWSEALAAAGIPVVTLMAGSIQDALDDMQTVGRLLGHRAEAEALTERILSGLEEVSARLEGVAPARVFVESFYPPLIAVSEGGFASELVRAAGGEPVSFGETTPEAVARLSPQVYIAPTSTAPSVEALSGRPGFAQIEAVAAGRAVIIEDALLFRPGPRMIEGVIALVERIHPPS